MSTFLFICEMFFLTVGFSDLMDVIVDWMMILWPE